MGAGWNEAEHRRYGFPFPPTRERMDIFAEQLEIVHRQWKTEPFSFEGEHYRLVDSDPLPKPVQSPHPPLIVGGRGGRRSVALAARWADEYNTVSPTPDECRALRERHRRGVRAGGPGAASAVRDDTLDPGAPTRRCGGSPSWRRRASSA